MALVLQPISEIPLIQPGDDLAAIIKQAIHFNKISVKDGDIFVITQKIVSKAENRYKSLHQISPSERALKIAASSGKDPRLVELILSESNEIIRVEHGVIIVEHRLGFICANAGIDHSNLLHEKDEPDLVLLLPLNPSASAAQIRTSLERTFHRQLGILIIDSHGRAWRNGVVGAAIGCSGVPTLSDQRGWIDLFGNELKITQVAIADELAAAASLMMGQSAEGFPVIHVTGFPYPLKDMPFEDLLRSKERDLFR